MSKQINLLLKFSHSTKILRFYSEKLKDWRTLMTRICKKTKDKWVQNLPAYTNLESFGILENKEKIVNLLCEIKHQKVMEFNEDFHLVIDCKKLNDVEFMKHASNIKFPQYKELHIKCIFDLNRRGRIILNQFLKNSIPDKLESLLIDGLFMTKISLFSKAFTDACLSVSSRIIISNFMITDTCFKQILEGARNCESLIFDLCIIDNNSQLHLDPALNYKLKHIEFFLIDLNRRLTLKLSFCFLILFQR